MRYDKCMSCRKLAFEFQQCWRMCLKRECWQEGHRLPGPSPTHCVCCCRERARAVRTSSGREALAALSLERAGAARPKKRPRRTRRQAGPVLVEVLGGSGMTKPSGAAVAPSDGVRFA